MSTYLPCSEVTFNLYKEEEEDERHKRQTLKFAHFLCFVGLTTTKRWHKYWQWFAITIKVSSNNTWWWGVILFDQITGKDGHWGALLLRDLLRLLLLCSFVNKVLHSVDLFNSHLCRMWYLNWMDYYCYREAEDDIRQSENVGGNNQYRDKVVNCNWSISFSLLINININTYPKG